VSPVPAGRWNEEHIGASPRVTLWMMWNPGEVN